ncbi:MAG: response regulator [Thermodesulfobacteriota bacterium]
MPKKRILIAEDHEIVIEGIKSILETHSDLALVGRALNGREAVKMATALQPDIVVMDIAMPGLNGIDATLQIRKTSPEIRIIIYTMNADRELIIDLFKAGISGFVLKEDPISDLVMAIKTVSKGNTYFSSRAPAVFVDYVNRLEKGEVQKDPFDTLSLREREIFQLLAEGETVKSISKHLFISTSTVETHKYAVMRKLGLHSLSDLIKLAVKKRIISV